MEKLPVCIAKTAKSLSDDPKMYGRPKDFTLTVREIELAAGAGFIVPKTGEITRMPGLPLKPAAENIDIDDSGKISGLF
jgi:formate--tetrahydrofolate ligase